MLGNKQEDWKKMRSKKGYQECKGQKVRVAITEIGEATGRAAFSM